MEGPAERQTFRLGDVNNPPPSGVLDTGPAKPKGENMKITCTKCNKPATWENQVGTYVHDEEGPDTHDVVFDPYVRLGALTGLLGDDDDVAAVRMLDNDEGELANAVVALIETAIHKAAERAVNPLLVMLEAEHIPLLRGENVRQARVRVVREILSR